MKYYIATLEDRWTIKEVTKEEYEKLKKKHIGFTSNDIELAFINKKHLKEKMDDEDFIEYVLFYMSIKNIIKKLAKLSRKMEKLEEELEFCRLGKKRIETKYELEEENAKQ